MQTVQIPTPKKALIVAPKKHQIPPTTKEALNLIGAQYGLKQSGKMAAICSCESTLYQDAISYAGWRKGMGLCGFIPSTWNYVLDMIQSTKVPQKCLVKFTGLEYSHPIFDAECNFIFASFLLNKEGDHHWDSSRACWGK